MSGISFVASGEKEVLWDRLSSCFESALNLRIASAFLGAGDEIVSWVQVDAKRRVEIIVRLEYPTNPATIEALRRHPQVSIRCSDPKRSPFHEKLFIALGRDGEPAGAYIGSANWTQGGLRRNQEVGVWISDRPTLLYANRHFKAQYQLAKEISDKALSELRLDFLRKASVAGRPRKDRGTFVSSWAELRSADDGFFLIKQNGIGANPFVEGEDDFSEFVRNQSSQTLSKVPSTFEKGLGVMISWIARRKDGSPDRLIYGRGRIAGFDRKRWRLPDTYLAELARRGIDREKIDHLRQWPEVLWLDPAEYIAYPEEQEQFIWLSDFMEPSFQGGFRWVSENVWKACNEALNAHTEKFGILPLDRQGIWWNQHVGITDSEDPLFMTKARLEEMNLEGRPWE